MSNRYNSVRRIQGYQGPMFQCHGTADEIVPLALARKLFEASPAEEKHFYQIHYGRHNDNPPPDYYATLSNFLDQVDGKSRDLSTTHRRKRERQMVS